MLVCVCVSLRALITNGVIWCDIGHVCDFDFDGFPLLLITLYDTCCSRMDGRGHINTACHEHLSKKTKVIQYQLQKDYPKDGALHL